MMRIAAVLLACAACSKPAAKPAPTPSSELPASPASPTNARAVEICDGWIALAKRCPDLDPYQPAEECRREFTAALADARGKQDADEIGGCVLGTGGCSEVAACLDRTSPSGLYAFDSFSLAADCVSSAPGKPTTHPLIGKPAPLAELASLRGSPVLVTFTALWESSAPEELRLLQRVTGAKVVVVLSNTAAELAAVKIRNATVVADTPHGDETLGPITKAWGVPAIPESFLIDGSGTVRYHFVRMHDWSESTATTCFRSLARK